MSLTIDHRALLTGLARYRDAALDGARDGLAVAADAATDRMRATTAHGDVTGATRASYRAAAVGRGETGSGSFAAAQSAANSLNPGHIASAGVAIDGELGVIFDSATDYQAKLETEHAGQKAVLGPTLVAEASGMTAAAARGAKDLR